MTGVSFTDLVAVATVGVTRKGLAVSELAGPAAGNAGVLDPADPAAALLDAAALLTAARRAGMRPAAGVTLPEPAGGPVGAARAGRGPERELPARAARLLRRIGADDRQLLADLLTAAGDAGYVLPAPLLPGLLDAAVRDAVLRPAVAGLLGDRGRWLIAYRPDWRRAVGQARADQPEPRAGVPAAGPAAAGTAAAGAGPGTVTADADLGTWRAGGRDERRGFLAGLRRRDPAAGRELLAAGWTRETGADRAALLAVLRHGLSAGDEDFLEAALDDRAGGVRDAARLLLGQLPGSAFRRRESGRAAPALGVERHGLRRRLAVTLPGEPDAAAVRDGVPVSSPVPGIGPGGWRLIHVLAAVPLADWTGRLGLPPADLLRLPVTDDLTVHLHAAWRLAAVRERDPDWALALLQADAGRPVKWAARAWPDDAALTAALPARLRAERVAALLAGAGVGDRAAAYALNSEVAACPTPWPLVLADAVTGALARAADRPDLPPPARALLNQAARGLPAAGGTDYAAALTRIAAAKPQVWSPLLESAAETIALRRAFLAELLPPAARPGPAETPWSR